MMEAFALAAALIAPDEGFRGLPYTDTEGNPTIGYGTLLPLTEAEGRLLLIERLKPDVEAVRKAWPTFDTLPVRLQARLMDMIYQLGPHGFLEFDKMRAAVDRGDWSGAAREALDSPWARRTPARAKEVAQALLIENRSEGDGSDREAGRRAASLFISSPAK